MAVVTSKAASARPREVFSNRLHHEHCPDQGAAPISWHRERSTATACPSASFIRSCCCQAPTLSTVRASPSARPDGLEQSARSGSAGDSSGSDANLIVYCPHRTSLTSDTWFQPACACIRIFRPAICLLALHLCQRRLGSEAARSWCRCVAVETCRAVESCSAGLIPLANCGIQRAEVAVAVGSRADACRVLRPGPEPAGSGLRPARHRGDRCGASDDASSYSASASSARSLCCRAGSERLARVLPGRLRASRRDGRPG